MPNFQNANGLEAGVSGLTYADNSGPMFNFYGKIPKTESKNLRSWLETLFSDKDITAPLSVDVTEDDELKVTYEYNGNSTNTVIVITHKDGSKTIKMHGDAEEIEVPRLNFDEEIYSDEYGECYVKYKGRNYTLEELLELVKKNERGR